MFNLVNYETGQRFDNFPYSVPISNIGIVPDFHPDFKCETFMSFSRLEVPFNDGYVLGKTDDIEVSNRAYEKMIKHYEQNRKKKVVGVEDD